MVSLSQCADISNRSDYHGTRFNHTSTNKGNTLSTEVAVIESTPAKQLEPFSSIEGNDFATRRELAAAVMGAKDLSSQLGVPFNIKHIIRQPVDVTNKETGVVSSTYRTTFVTDNGDAFAATSRGIDIAVDNILATMGNPAGWGDEVFAVIAEKVGSGNTAYFTLKPIIPAKGKK